MALVECKEPVFDRQVEKILEGLGEGKGREEVAKGLGYKNPVSMDNYMRRRNFSWDSKSGKFVPASERYGLAKVTPFVDTSTKAGAIINSFAIGKSDSKEIAKKHGFAGHRELASYMSSKSYVWNVEQGNYIKSEKQITVKSVNTEAMEPLDYLTESPTPDKYQGGIVPEELLQYLPLLRMLDESHDKLKLLLEVPNDTGQIPRYSIPGNFACKTVHMAISLDQMVKEFSKEKNISQKDLFEVALLEFFRKYGFVSEVEHLLKG